jgi:hypothetical protein
MATPTETAMTLLQRAQDAIQRRTRKLIPAEEATVTSLLQAPYATVDLTSEQAQQLESLEHPPVAAA